MTRRQLIGFAAALAGGGLVAGWQDNTAIPLPPVVTSDWEITCLLPDAGGIWVGTSGGITRIEANGTRRRFTRADGLPTHEVRRLERTTNGVRAALATGAAEWNGTAWKAVTGAFPLSAPPLPTLPPGATGTHVIAWARTESGGLLVAVWGENRLYRCTGTTWRVEPSGLPSGVGKQITALADANGVLWAGTRRAGLWQRDGGQWRQVTTPGATPTGHNAQAIARHDGSLWISTLDDGLMRYDGRRWTTLAPPTLSSDAPRQMAVFQNRLYIRHGTGVIDCWNGVAWSKDVFRSVLPRRQASALSVGGGRLVVGVWGGFSVWDGGQWVHHLHVPELAGIPVASLLVSGDGKTLWIGTQGRGLCEADMMTGKVRSFHDERHGLPDDWVTEIAENAEGGLYIGTFVGGLAMRPPGAARFTVADETAGENVTGIVPRAGMVWAATRHGVRTIPLGKKSAAPLAPPPWLTGADVEAQCLFADGADTWVGTRTGIYRVESPKP